jgi:HEAT repeat protein
VLAAAALVIGLAIGRFTVPSTSDQQEQIAALQAEVHTTRQLVALSLLEQRSASERLRGVNWSQRLEEPDPQVISALVHALRYDSSVDVRLAALDALRRYRSNPEVREALLQSLNSAQSPLVQISVIDLLVDARDPAAPGALRQLRSSPSVNTAVRKHAEWALQQF